MCNGNYFVWAYEGSGELMENVVVRIIHEEDAHSLLEVMENAESSNFMLFGPGERKMTLEGAKKMIQVLSAEEHALAVAEVGEELVGYIIMRGEKISRLRHRAAIVIGVHEKARGKGVGKALFEFIHGIAKKRGLKRLELTVMAHNEAAFHLYRKMGYEVEGLRKCSLLVDGEYVDEYALAKIF